MVDSTMKSVLSAHSKINRTKVLKTGGSLVQIESIAECSTGNDLTPCLKYSGGTEVSYLFCESHATFLPQQITLMEVLPWI